MRLLLTLSALALCACVGVPSEADKGPRLNHPTDGPFDAATAGCDYNWAGSEHAGACPASWFGAGDGCDCGCQRPDPDCGEEQVTPPVIPVTPSTTHVRVDMVPQNWVDLSDDEFARATIPPPFDVGPVAVPGEPEYAVTTRLQVWLDRAYDEVRAIRAEQAPNEAFILPRPRVRIVPSRQMQGWAAGVGVCLRVPTRVAAGPARETQEATQILIVGDRLSDRMPGRAFGVRREPCVDSAWSSDISGYVAYYNSFAGPCHLREENGGLVIEGAQCEYTGATTQAGELVVLAGTPVISLTSEMIASAPSEEAVVSILLHELGHYVLSHVTNGTFDSRYDYWYQQNEDPSAEFPVAIADSARIAADVAEVAGTARVRIPGQTFSPWLTRFLTSSLNELLPAVCQGDDCACADALAMLNSSWTSEVECVGCSYASASSEAQYLAYESAIRSCSANVSVRRSPRASEISRASIIAALETRGLTPYAPSRMTDGSSLLAWLDAIERRAGEPESTYQDLLREIEERHLGQYTVEQHADDFAAELWARVGLAPADKVVADLALVHARPLNSDAHAFVRMNGMTLLQLETLTATGWRQDGNYVFPQLGFLHDPHHSSAYRLFNTSREIIAHQYEASTTPVERGDAQWSTIVELARSLGTRVVVRPPRDLALETPDDGTIVDGEIPLIID